MEKKSVQKHNKKKTDKASVGFMSGPLAKWVAQFMIEKSRGLHQEIALLEQITVSFIIPNVSALQIPSDNNMLQASIIIIQYSRRAFHYTVTSHNPPTSVALTEHQTHDSETEQKRRMRQPGDKEEGEWGRNGACL